MTQRITRRKFLSHAGVAAATLPLGASVFGASPVNSDHLDTEHEALVLWYDKPATEWTEALPIGNGSLGAMIFGGPEVEQLQLNEDTLYAGSPYDPNNSEALKALPEARRRCLALPPAQECRRRHAPALPYGQGQAVLRPRR